MLIRARIVSEAAVAPIASTWPGQLAQARFTRSPVEASKIHLELVDSGNERDEAT